MTRAIEPIVIDPAKYAIVLTTSLDRLRAAGACTDRYAHLIKCLGGTSFDHAAPINLLTILEHNGAEDCVWALCATEQNCDVVARLMAADSAEIVLPIFERERPGDMRPREAVNVARAYAIGTARAAASDAASDAAWDAAWAAASDAASDAAWAAARAAASDAASAAAWDAAWAADWAAQDEIIRRYLLPPPGVAE